MNLVCFRSSSDVEDVGAEALCALKPHTPMVPHVLCLESLLHNICDVRQCILHGTLALFRCAPLTWLAAFMFPSLIMIAAGAKIVFAFLQMLMVRSADTTTFHTLQSNWTKAWHKTLMASPADTSRFMVLHTATTQ